jgi:putative radical SAM enzyme (TIGR03279 family)
LLEKKNKSDKQRGHLICEVQADSIAQEMEIEAGDRLISINGHELTDIFDYHYYIEDEFVDVLIEKADGEEWELEIEKDYDEDLGLVFENGLMDEYRSCTNQCIFCFIDQMPPGMRDTLYFKDDDSRLSFLQGNYITLTNMKDADLERIIAYHLGPINISVHTTNPDLRCEMLHNRFAGEALKKMDRLYEAGIPMNGQIVLCKGVNDKDELERTIKDLMRYIPVMESVSIVPVGITKYREGLYPMEPFTKDDAKEMLETVHRFQKQCMEEYGIHFIHASDEWYLLAQEQMPKEECYDGYVQLENGVGMIRLLEDEFEEALLEANGDGRVRTCSVATGLLAAPLLKRLSERVREKYPNVDVHVYPIRNDFFGEQITVSGLVTGQDLKAQLSGAFLGECLLLPCNMLRSGEEVFLDDLTCTQLSESLQVPIDIVKSSGQDLLAAMIGE